MTGLSTAHILWFLIFPQPSGRRPAPLSPACAEERTEAQRAQALLAAQLRGWAGSLQSPAPMGVGT